MIKVNPGTINDLLELAANGASVTLTSHPGNASLYKLALWSCGIPENLWDVTCCKADANNWPMHRLVNGQAELLVSPETHRLIMSAGNATRRFVTAYQFTAGGERLGRVHVREMQKLFPGVISTCSRLILQHEGTAREMYCYLAHTKPEVFGRFISPDGIMVPSHQRRNADEVVESFMNVLHELDHLLLSDEPIVTKGGSCYEGAMVQLSTMLCQYWQSGRPDRYDLSGPDMIHYSVRTEYQRELMEMLDHLRKWKPNLIPKTLAIHMYPGTAARVGHLPDHVSQEVMDRKKYALCHASTLSTLSKKSLYERAKDDEKNWPVEIRPAEAPYYSQYDLAQSSRGLEVDRYWRELPIHQMRDTLIRANNILKVRG